MRLEELRNDLGVRGLTLEADLDARRAALAASDPGAWTDAARDAFMAPQLAQADGDIRRYGSDFAVRDPFGVVKDAPPWLALKPSFARGGLSNAWGASVLPYRQEDMAGWPITRVSRTPAPSEVGIPRTSLCTVRVVVSLMILLLHAAARSGVGIDASAVSMPAVRCSGDRASPSARTKLTCSMPRNPSRNRR